MDTVSGTPALPDGRLIWHVANDPKAEEGVRVRFPLSVRPHTARDALKMVEDLLGRDGRGWLTRQGNHWVLNLTVLRQTYSPQLGHLDWAEGTVNVAPEVGSYQEHPDGRTPVERTLVDFVVTREEFLAATEQETGTPPATEHVLPFDVVKGTRRYLEQIVSQANGCYDKGWYDACSVMVRKLVEVLIIAVYEKKGEAETIKKDGNFLMLGGLVEDILTRTTWNLGRETKAALPLLKSLGDRSAHNRYYMARKGDVDKVLPGLRVAVEDLLHQAGIVV